MKVKPKDKPHYVNNADFSTAVVAHVSSAREASSKGDTKPVVPDYIARCFLKIAEGLSHKANFVRYTYREEMVMDAVENCLKAIENYNLETATRTGKPNAFAYFTQISWYAFLRRIQKEKKQMHLKYLYVERSGIMEQVSVAGEDSRKQVTTYIEYLHTHEKYAESPYKSQKKKNKIKNLEKFMR